MRTDAWTAYDRDWRSFLGKHKYSWWLNPIRAGVRYAHEALNWSNNDPTTNGERGVIAALPAAPVVIDVGAHLGDWTRLLLDLRPGATVVCCDAAPDLQAHLSQRFASASGVHVYRAGLAAGNGSGTLIEYPSQPRLSSLVPYPHPDVTCNHVPVALATGDQLMRELELSRIDLLKIDTEGSELFILRGFRDALQAGAVRAIQFEYGRANIYSRSLLADFYELLAPLGYDIGPVTPNGATSRSYAPGHEDFFVANYLAVRR